MKLFAQLFFVAAGIGLSGAHAAPVSVFSELSLSTSFSINNGNPIDGADVGPGLLARTLGASSTVDSVDTNENIISNSQVGNPFTTPPIPFLSSGTDATSLQGSPLEGAQGSWDVTISQSADSNNGQVLNRSIDTGGTASILFATDPINSSGLSFFDVSRPFLIENTSNASVSFDIAGFFASDLSANIIGDAGLARTSLTYSILFEQVAGAVVSYSEVTPFSQAIDDSATGATVSQSFTASDSGLFFEVETVSDFANGGGLARAEGGSGYSFLLELDPGVSFVMTEAWTQRNDVSIRQQDSLPPVPLPAGGLLLLTGIAGVACLKCRKKRNA
ncbi:VPLPA-CTERM protein sorting domain-containing protein [Roseovarius tolerans]|uniref:VPLPA-CTERM protein sorting domain-containing protein n=1 Tax=Roseovarius tolerans TaxID=74031 RepID=A0A1H8BQH7_9RHOB|nr:VPLPA-CTERM sorting domain-containing protein [Roseovarius tolerans]SEM84278.1 VPLPA-CTERM protein sorting domain-containing protein [Roseovarius tolerans]